MAARVILFLFAFLLTGSVIMTVHSCSGSPVRVEEGEALVSLDDGSAISAADGSVARQLADWLRDPSAPRKRFEVGGEQFIPGTSRPAAGVEVRVARLAQMLRAYPKVLVHVVGASNPGTDPALDQRRSEQRARLAAGMLLKAGIDASRLAVSAEGGRSPRYAPGSADATKNDRIILELERRPSA